jgi:hypothetical protein
MNISAFCRNSNLGLATFHAAYGQLRLAQFNSASACPLAKGCPLHGYPTCISQSGPGEAVKKLGQTPSRALFFQGFRRLRSEPVPFFHSLGAREMAPRRFEAQ